MPEYSEYINQCLSLCTDCFFLYYLGWCISIDGSALEIKCFGVIMDAKFDVKSLKFNLYVSYGAHGFVAKATPAMKMQERSE